MMLMKYPSHKYTYKSAVTEIRRINKQEKVICRPGSLTKLYSHGSQKNTCYVLLHGFTNSPQQYVLLAKYLFRNGSNVLVPRLPYHGLKDRMTEEQKFLTADKMIHSCSEAVDLANGLGKKVVVLGISAGGVTAAWIAQHRTDVEKVVLVSPVFGFSSIPLWFSDVFVKISKFLPNNFLWWDPRVKEKLLPLHAYPRFSIKALGEIFSVGNKVLKNQNFTHNKVKKIVIITTAFDTAIHLPTVDMMSKLWQDSGNQVVAFQFPRKLKIWHDMLDPRQSYQQVVITYPVILKLIGEA